MSAPDFKYEGVSLQVVEKVVINDFDGELLLKAEFRRRFAPNRLRLEQFRQIEEFEGKVKSTILFVSLNLDGAENEEGEEEEEEEEEEGKNAVHRRRRRRRRKRIRKRDGVILYGNKLFCNDMNILAFLKQK